MCDRALVQYRLFKTVTFIVITFTGVIVNINSKSNIVFLYLPMSTLGPEFSSVQSDYCELSKTARGKGNHSHLIKTHTKVLYATDLLYT